MKRIEAVITPWTLDTFKAAAPRLGISEFELVEVYRLGSETTVGAKGLYQGCESRADLSPRLRVEFVMFDDDVQATVHRLLELIHPESISVFRLDQEIRTISSAKLPFEDARHTGSRDDSYASCKFSDHRLEFQQNGVCRAITASRPAPIRH
jgi:nitrogen regulatory protein PII